MAVDASLWEEKTADIQLIEEAKKPEAQHLSDSFPIFFLLVWTNCKLSWSRLDCEPGQPLELVKVGGLWG